MLLLIDNYDSFTYNLVQYFQMLKQEVRVFEHDEITLEQIEQLKPDHLVISPGPGNPFQAGISLSVIDRFAGRIPILGVCLGHQCIGQYFGARIVQAQQIMHGKTSIIHHTEKGLFEDLPNPLTVTRYHSLVIDPETLPTCLEMTAQDERGEIMAVSHRELNIHGVQFHPESIASESGLEILAHFIVRHDPQGSHLALQSSDGAP
jgi:anthranilate synthase/aminodeoxychorismate synthase-like glutamine amidotransferase